MADFEALPLPNLISRKIWVTEKFWKIHTVVKEQLFQLIYRDFHLTERDKGRRNSLLFAFFFRQKKSNLTPSTVVVLSKERWSWEGKRTSIVEKKIPSVALEKKILKQLCTSQKDIHFEICQIYQDFLTYLKKYVATQSEHTVNEAIWVMHLKRKKKFCFVYICFSLSPFFFGW